MLLNKENPSINIDFYNKYYSARWNQDISPYNFADMVKNLIQIDKFIVYYKNNEKEIKNVVELDKQKEPNLIRIENSNEALIWEGDLEETRIGYLSEKNSLSELEEIYRFFIGKTSN